MLNTSRSRVRALAAIGMAAVTATVGTVSYQASAAEVVAPAADSRGGGLPAIAEAIKPPAGSRVIGTFQVVTGTQGYTCVVADGATTGAYTAASVPEAQLSGRSGRIHHFAGPSWQSERDGSLVTAAKLAASPLTGTIPELLLQVQTHTGTGILSRADYINRLSTSGGVAPATCTSGETVKVPYQALYVFWDAPAA